MDMGDGEVKKKKKKADGGVERKTVGWKKGGGW